MTTDYGIAWYAFRTKPRHEKAVSLAIKGKGYEQFLPTYEKRRVVAGRVRSATLPLIPGYVFCRMDASARLTILTIPGVFSIIEFGDGPTPVDESEIEALKTLVSSGLDLSPCSEFRPGRLVRMKAGPLNGVEGVIISDNDTHDLVVSISLLQRSVCVKVDKAWVETQAESETGQGISGFVETGRAA